MAGLSTSIEQLEHDYQNSIERLDSDMNYAVPGRLNSLSPQASTLAPTGHKAVMGIVALERVEMVPGAVRLSLMDSQGATHQLDLQPHAEAQVSTALLTARKDTQGLLRSRGPVIADDITVSTFTPSFEASSSVAPISMLEVQLTDKATLQVALPAFLEQKLLGILLQRRAESH